MRIEKTRIVDGKVWLDTRTREWLLPNGVYRTGDGTSIVVRDHGIAEAVIPPDTSTATAAELESFLDDLNSELSTVGADAQLANIDLQNMLQKQQQTIQTLSNVSKVLHDTAMAVIRKIG